MPVVVSRFVHLRHGLALLALASCGGDGRAVDAAIDTAQVQLDCSSYCREIQANCTARNAQYSDVEHCAAACASFAIEGGKITDTSGNTLGCRIFYASGPARTTPESSCAAAGPVGDQISAAPPGTCSGGNVCTSFCALQIRACGAQDAPLPGDPRDGDNNHLFQYQNMADCMRLCVGFDRTHVYTATATGNSLACRVAQATSAALSVAPAGVMYCAYTGADAKGPCVGPATP